MEGLDRRDQVIIGLQGQYDISVSSSGTRSYIYLAMLLDHGDFRSTPVSGHSLDRRACLKGANERDCGLRVDTKLPTRGLAFPGACLLADLSSHWVIPTVLHGFGG